MKDVLIEKYSPEITIVKMNRPHAANALSRRMIEGLIETLHIIAADDHVRVVILTGQGEKAFCAGADLHERLLMSDREVEEILFLLNTLMNKIENLPLPVISALNGVAYGGGLELALACDIRMAAEESKLGLTETSLAIIPGAGGTQRLPRLIGPGKAKELIFLAQRISSQEALKIGLLQHVFPQNELLQRTIAIATKIASNGPLALKAAKAAINKGLQGSLAEGLEIERELYRTLIPTKDRIEGLRSFSEKRIPNYDGR